MYLINLQKQNNVNQFHKSNLQIQMTIDIVEKQNIWWAFSPFLRWWPIWTQNLHIPKWLVSRPDLSCKFHWGWPEGLNPYYGLVGRQIMI